MSPKAVPSRSEAFATHGYLTGSLLVMASGLLWSFGGLAVRLAGEADGWQYMVYRAGGQVIATALFSLAQRRGSVLHRFVRAGPAVWLAAFCAATSAMTYVFALKTTTVANVALIGSTAPLWTAVMAAVLLGERIDRTTAVAVALGVAGIAVMERGEIAAGNLFGNVMALAAALGLAGYSTCLRGGGERDWEAAVFGFGLMALLAAVAGTLVLGEPLRTAPVGMAAGFTHGFLLNGVGSTLFVYGARHVPAAQMTILAQTETICGPLWVWLLLGEVPLPATLEGGALILLAIGLRATAGFTARPQPRIAD